MDTRRRDINILKYVIIEELTEFEYDIERLRQLINDLEALDT